MGQPIAAVFVDDNHIGRDFPRQNDGFGFSGIELSQQERAV